ncbi:unnamed protein product [Fusarium graminearum]|nr:unnamed protein product [Fusarium graminearum]
MESTHDDDTDTSDSTLDTERPAHGSVNDIPDESDFPEFFPKYTNDDIRGEHIEIDQEWHTAVLSEWLAWGHAQDESEDWKFWAAQLHTNKTMTMLCNHVLVAASPLPSWQKYSSYRVPTRYPYGASQGIRNIGWNKHTR